MPAYKRDGRWRWRKVIRLPDGNKKRVYGTPSLNTKAAAQADERRTIERILRGEESGPGKEVPRFEDFAKVFLRDYARTHNKVSTVMAKECVLRTKLVPHFGGKRLSEIRVADIERLKSKLLSPRGKKKPLSKKTVNNALGVLNKMLGYAVELELIESFPKIRFLKVPKADVEFLDFKDAMRLFEAAESEADVFAMIGLGLEAGLRVGEIRGLVWDDIDLARRRLRVARTIYRGHVGSTKGGRSRWIPMSRRVYEGLKAVRALSQLQGSWVFLGKSGRHLTRGEADAKLWRQCRKAGVRKIGWHTLRHTFCSHLAMRGAAARAIQELAGHASITTTQ